MTSTKNVLQIHGAGQEVGRSNYVLDIGEKFLLDSGIKLLPNGEMEFPYPIDANLKAIILSHAHFDHSGNLPSMYKHQNIPTYLTPPTLELSKMLWMDSINIAEKEATEPMYYDFDVQRTERFCLPISYKRPIEIAKGVHLEFFDAGHIAGAAMCKIDYQGKSFLYTGDFMGLETRMHDGADLSLGEVDYLLMESTYGTREHPDRKQEEKRMIKEIETSINKGSHALVASFAIGRSQELLDIIMTSGLSDVPVYLDGMCKKASQIYLAYPEYAKDFKQLKSNHSKVRWIQNQNQRKEALKKPGIVISTAGMLMGGPIMYYMSKIHQDEHASLSITGYQVKESPGRMLLDTGKIEINGELITPKMKVHKFDFSAHAPHQDLINTVKKLNPSKVILIHGDERTTSDFRDELNGMGFSAINPKVGDKIELD